VVGPGWRRLGPDPAILAWATAAAGVARGVVERSTDSWRSGGTWFVGVDALPNGPEGRVDGVAFPWSALPLTPVPLHRAQLSVIRPGYPQPSPEETPAAFAFRRDRDAAHLDGLMPVGPDRRRMIVEPHAWILGLPLTETDAAPLVVWEGSQTILRAALQEALCALPPADWGRVDITDAYQAARRAVLSTCRRVRLPVRPGEATLLHRLALHGVEPWRPDDHAPPEGRMIAYLRPEMASVEEWLTAP
jgi:hypothetical protein